MEKLKRCSVCGSVKLIPLNEAENQYKCHSCLKVFTLKAPSLSTPEISESPSISKRKLFFDKLMSATVELNAYFETDVVSGTGFFISKEYLLTNAHVIMNRPTPQTEPMSAIQVVGNNYEKNKRFLFDVVAFDMALDVAILKLQEGENTFVTFSKNLFNGAQVYAIGNSRGDGLCIVEGIVSDVLRIVDSKQYFMTSAIVTNGNSGCPVFGADGNLLGMITEGSKYSVAMNYAIPSAILLDYVQKTEASKNITIL